MSCFFNSLYSFLLLVTGLKALFLSQGCLKIISDMNLPRATENCSLFNSYLFNITTDFFRFLSLIHNHSKYSNKYIRITRIFIYNYLYFYQSYFIDLLILVFNKFLVFAVTHCIFWYKHYSSFIFLYNIWVFTFCIFATLQTIREHCFINWLKSLITF